MKQLAELLAPAGSIEALYAAYAAGADAVYVGGGSFGARAYADNPSEQELLQAIDYAHLHGKKLYLTVNTLLKEAELEEQLYRYLLPYYREGLDAAIVQDLGVLSRLRDWFPDLPLHASTQMTMSGSLSAGLLQELGVSRIVTPRELSLSEIRAIHETSDLEIESFVHGALCYCYSGQCLFSSIAGGRSGNRGRCAQPCRMPYRVFAKDRELTAPDKGYVLSPKDLCTIELLPQILEAGVYSLKIEGRMKKAEYTAGVVSIYRKYLDQCLEHPQASYQVSREDKQHLMDLFNRKGFTDGYYTRHNKSSMITFEKPDFRTTDEAYQTQLRTRYLDVKLKENIKGIVRIFQGEPAILEVTTPFLEKPIQVMGEAVMAAQRQPLTVESVRKQMEKLGDTDFRWQELSVETDGESFYPVGKLNELRRDALKQLQDRIVSLFLRRKTGSAENRKQTSAENEVQGLSWCASIETKEQLFSVLQENWIDQVNLESHICEPEQLSELVDAVHQKQKRCYLSLPQVFRQENKPYYQKHLQAFQEAGFDGVTAGNIEGLLFAKEVLPGLTVGADASLYGWNRAAKQAFTELGCGYQTLPAELNRKELAEVADTRSLLMVYGRLPMMISAQCVCANTAGCQKKLQELTLIDRMGNQFPVKNRCRECYNIIYNNRPVSLSEDWRSVSALPVKGYQLSFTTEDSKETKEVLALYRELAETGSTERHLKEITRGHYKRGTE